MIVSPCEYQCCYDNNIAVTIGQETYVVQMLLACLQVHFAIALLA